MRILTLILILLLNAQYSWAGVSRSFDGTNDEVAMGNVHDVTTNDFTIGIWVRSTENASFEVYIGKRATGGGVGYNLDQSSADVTACSVSDGTDVVFSLDPTDNDGVWTFIACTYDDDLVGVVQTTAYFHNAVQVDTDSSILVGSATSANTFRVGQDGAGDEDYAGLAAYGFVWIDKVMTATDLAEFMWKPDLMEQASGFWPLWGNSPEIDLSASANTGTVAGGTVSASGPNVGFGGLLPL